MKLFKLFKECKYQRKNYKIKPCIRFFRDTHYYWFSLIPTITWLPWISRWEGVAIVEIWWLYYHITIGEWEQKKVKEGERNG